MTTKEYTMHIDKCRNIKDFEGFCKSERLARPKDILNVPHYCFYDESSKLLGFIYLEEKQGRLFLSGEARRGIPEKVDWAINHICNGYKHRDIYSETTVKEAATSLIRNGFKRFKDEFYIRRAA